jgi:hypothetical protein
MKTPTYEEFLANPGAVIEQVHRAARRERAEAVDELIVQPLKRAIQGLMPRQASATLLNRS